MTISMIRRVINRMPEGTIFTTRDMLVFGMRTAVDQSLCWLVKKEKIRRLARGVFAKCSDENMTFTELQIVKAKARAFGRNIIEKPLSSQTNTYFVEGHSSKFCVGKTTIHLKKVGQRKIYLSKSKAGEAAHSVWQLGAKDNVDGRALMNTMEFFDRNDYAELRRNIRWMPAWLSDQIKSRPWDHFYDNWTKTS